MHYCIVVLTEQWAIGIMNNRMDNQREIIKLLLLELNGSCSQDEFDHLCRQLKSSPEMLDFYVEFMILYSGLVQSGENIQSQTFEPIEHDRCILEPALWAQLSREELDAPAIEIQKENDILQTPRKYEKVEMPPRVYSKGYLWFSIISIAATFMLILYVWTHPRHLPQDIATVTDIYHAQWEDSDAVIQKGTRLFDDRKLLNLTQGVVKVQFDDGVRVVVQSPAVFSLDSDKKMRLTQGKLYAKVPKQGIGFRVETPNCGVIDLGTEFGVNVSGRGETNVHLFKGKASLVTASQNNTQQSQILKPHEAKRITATGDVHRISFQDHQFVRDFDSERSVMWNGRNLSLADIASGGNGWGRTHLNVGINQVTGKLVSGNKEGRLNPASKGFVPVSQLPYVDGVFVPDCGEGPTQLTSAGHVFDGFGDTGGGYFMPIGSYSSINMMYEGREDVRYTPIHLSGYPEETAVNLCVHANSGITFDLQKIRESIPFVKITGFSSVYGIPITREDQGDVHADFYVLVDGVARMVKKDVYNQAEPGQVSIPLTETDRFLTLACTEGAVNFGDWSLFVNPELVLELAD